MSRMTRPAGLSNVHRASANVFLQGSWKSAPAAEITPVSMNWNKSCSTKFFYITQSTSPSRSPRPQATLNLNSVVVHLFDFQSKVVFLYNHSPKAP